MAAGLAVAVIGTAILASAASLLGVGGVFFLCIFGRRGWHLSLHAGA